MNLGILDLCKNFTGMTPASRVRATIRLASLAESAGFDRYWLAEHHVRDTAVTAPEVLIPLIATATQTIRVGSAGVLLRYYSPLKIAEVYLSLEAVAPGRIDLGICRGPGLQSETMANMLVSGNAEELSDRSFESKVAELLLLFRNIRRNPGASSLLGPYPSGVIPPSTWVLGSGSRSVDLALCNGSNYGFMCFYPKAQTYGPALVAKYLEERELRRLEDTTVAIAVSVICCRTSAEAERINSALVSRGSFSSNIVGEPEYCLAELQAMAKQYQVDDVLVACLLPNEEHHREQLELLATAAAARRS
jgi:luciferase family oxidoreductase group 1